MLRKLFISSLILSTLPALAFAQSDEIIVTATKRVMDSAYQEPHVVIKRRPDNIILSVSVICDTRNAKQRLEELEATMINVVNTARKIPAIELGTLIEREDDNGNDITFVKPYEQSKFGEYVSAGYRADTSDVRLVLKTKVTNAYETEEDAMAVLNNFMESVKTEGRTEFIDTDDPIMSIINPSQYRYPLIDDIAQDAKRVASAFGTDYHVEVDGLEAPIVFYQTGELELTLFIPYGFDVTKQK